MIRWSAIFLLSVICFACSSVAPPETTSEGFQEDPPSPVSTPTRQAQITDSPEPTFTSETTQNGPVATDVPAGATPGSAEAGAAPVAASAGGCLPEAPVEVLSELFFLPETGGGGDWLCAPGDPSVPPSAAISKLDTGQDSFAVCVFNPPFDAEFHLDVCTPDGLPLISTDMVIDEAADGLEIYRIDTSGGRVKVGEGLVQDGATGLQIDLSWPLTMPERAYLLLSSDQPSIEASFQFSFRGEERLSVLPPASPPGSALLVEDGCLPFSEDEAVEVIGAGFPPDQELPLEIYDWPGYALGDLLAVGGAASIDSEGHFSAQIVVDSDWPEGLYYIVAVIDPSMDPYYGYRGPAGCFRVP